MKLPNFNFLLQLRILKSDIKSLFKTENSQKIVRVKIKTTKKIFSDIGKFNSIICPVERIKNKSTNIIAFLIRFQLEKIAVNVCSFASVAAGTDQTKLLN